MTDLIKSINPATRIATEADARAVARGSSIALWLSAARYAVAVGTMIANYGAIQALATGQAEAMNQPGMASGIAMSMVGGAAVVMLIEIGAGVWQWKRPGVILPIVWLILIAYGAFQFVRAGAPMTGLGVVVAVLLVVCGVLHASAIRGGLWLERFRKAQH